MFYKLLKQTLTLLVLDVYDKIFSINFIEKIYFLKFCNISIHSPNKRH